jgi:FMN phosphatase YigB (HAD superfamily)
LDDGIAPGDVLVVDDQAKNLDAARSLGITAVAATGDLTWCDAVDRFLAARRASTR